MIKEERIKYHLKSILPEEVVLQNVQNADFTKNIKLAQNSFLKGYHISLSESPDNFIRFINSLCSAEKGFMLEGASMACILLDELSKSRTNYFSQLNQSRKTIEKRFMAIGIGCASKYLKKDLNWFLDEEFALFKEEILDGYGFFMFHIEKKSANVRLHKYRTIFQGIGRAILFNSNGKIDYINTQINNIPEELKFAVWKGIGVATAFTGNEHMYPELKTISDSFISFLENGISQGINLKTNL